METSTSISLTKTPTFYTPLSRSKTQVENLMLLYRPAVKPHAHVRPGHQISLKLRQPVPWTSRLRASSSVCDKGINAATRKLTKDEMMNSMEEEEEECINEVGVEVENCRDDDDGNYNHGIVELMEGLEREAIMGKDEGRDPLDYNRRAHIFYKSSRVFQALKEKSSSTPDSATTTTANS